MMKRFLSIALAAALLVLCPTCALADYPIPLPPDDDWFFIGYTYGGITFAVPKDFVNFDLTASETAQGFILMGGNGDFVVQMRQFQPDELNYDDFKAMIEQIKTAEFSTRTDGDSEILVYRNMRPNAYSELYGVAMTGLDGLFYKISVFTGDDEAFDEDAPVWEIAEVIGQTARHQDFSEWGIDDSSNAPSNDPSNDLQSRISSFLNQFLSK